jgi:cation transport ATPase
VQPAENVEDFNPTYLRQRKPSLALVALFAILDPPREEAIQAAKVAHNAGITVKMITGALGARVEQGAGTAARHVCKAAFEAITVHLSVL